MNPRTLVSAASESIASGDLRLFLVIYVRRANIILPRALTRITPARLLMTAIYVYPLLP